MTASHHAERTGHRPGIRPGSLLVVLVWWFATLWLLDAVSVKPTFSHRWAADAEPPEMLMIGVACWIVAGAWSVRALPLLWPLLLTPLLWFAPEVGGHRTGEQMIGRLTVRTFEELFGFGTSGAVWPTRYEGPIQQHAVYVIAALLGALVQAELFARRGTTVCPHRLIEWERRLRRRGGVPFPAFPSVRFPRGLVKVGPMVALLIWWGLTLLAMREIAARGDAGWMGQAEPVEMILFGSAAWLLTGAWCARASPLLWPGLCVALITLAQMGGDRAELLTLVTTWWSRSTSAWTPVSGPVYSGPIQVHAAFVATALLGGLVQAEVLWRRGVAACPHALLAWEARVMARRAAPGGEVASARRARD
jgi:hypothetical protein